ncbi:MAG: cyclodeaminase/cyclohydrolase family protein [Clostridiales bacterium]|nr:cyclodeaminase/cyclohydrolase family protein [Clostridiales bacterium]MDD7347721.1 cyclodeaminase/cyclohydrolase family protein [Clostridiales bacterium]MDY4060897.1 cyclodeaminase/cyclohydrolase family protein [Anaerovoracaceae bacterium]
MKKLIDLDIRTYMGDLASNSPAPGGGSASALAGAQGIALVMMVAELTVGKERYAEYEEVCQRAISGGREILNDFLKAIDDDTEAYNKVGAAFKLPKATEEEKSVRSAEIQDATVLATRVPLHTMEITIRALKIAESVVGMSNPNCASDIGVGALNLKAALLGAWLNVKINLPGIKDEALQKEISDHARDMIAEGEKIADYCYRTIEGEL